jgi:hypothetical protein
MIDGLLTVCLAEEAKQAAAEGTLKAMKAQALELREEESPKEDDSISKRQKLG